MEFWRNIDRGKETQLKVRYREGGVTERKKTRIKWRGKQEKEIKMEMKEKNEKKRNMNKGRMKEKYEWNDENWNEREKIKGKEGKK